MISLNIQLFGGRGSFSSLSGKTNGDMLQNKKGKPSIQLNVSHMERYLIKDMNKFEDYMSMSKEKVEYGYMIDRKGKMVAGAKGNRGSVGIAYDNQKGMLVTHNHPGAYGGTFSDADINHLTRENLREIRAVAKEGTYSMKATRKANPIGLNKALAKDMASIEKKAVLNASQKSLNYSGRKRTNMYRKAYTDTISDWYSNNAGKYGYKYSFKPNKDFKI